MSTHFRTCPLCEATCGLEIEVRQEGGIRVRGDREDVFSKGFLCPKGSALGKLHDDPDRLTQPLVKIDGVHTPVDWDEAFEAVAAKLGPIMATDRQAVGIYLGNPSIHNHASAIFARALIFALGTKARFSASSVDQLPKHISAGMMFGSPTAIPVPDLDRTDYLLMLGANPVASNGSLCTAPNFEGRLKELTARGGKLIVIDPRRTETAKLATRHIFIRPGTDAALLAGIVNVIIAEVADSRLDRLQEYVEGFDRLAESTRRFTPSAVERFCGISTEDMTQLALDLLEAPTAAVYSRLGTHTAEFGGLCAWLVDAINVLTGNLDRAGGAMFPMSPNSSPRAAAGGKGFTMGRFTSRVSNFPEAIGEIPVAFLAEEILTPGKGQIRAMITMAGNPVRSSPNSQSMNKAFESLDAMVSVDIYLNETTRHADVILPPPSPLEKSHFDVAFYGFSVRNIANYSPAIFDKSGPSDEEIIARLSLIAMGMPANADPEIVYDATLNSIVQSATKNAASPSYGVDPENAIATLQATSPADRVLEAMIRSGPYGDGFKGGEGLNFERLLQAPHGIDLGPLGSRIPEILETPSAMVDMAPTALVSDLDRLDSTIRTFKRLEAGSESPSGLRLIGRRHVRSNNSWMHNIEVLVKGRPRCTLLVNPNDAQKRGLVDGALALISSRVGSLEAQVEITDDMMQGTVSLPHGWGHQESPGTTVARRYAGVASNLLTDETAIDVMTGNAVLNGIPVTVTSL